MSTGLSRRTVLVGAVALGSSAAFFPSASAAQSLAVMPPRRMVRTNGIQLAVHEAGSGPAVVLLHGWPELAFSWRHQIDPLAAAGYRVIVPDQRGYGWSDRPTEIDAYDMTALAGDIVGLLDALSVERAVVVGHDWGGIVGWQLPLLHPTRIAGVVGVNTPFVPRLPIEPIALLRFVFGDGMYVVRMQRPGAVEALLDPQPERFFRTQMRKHGITPAAFAGLPREAKTFDFLGQYADPPHDAPVGEPVMPDADLQVFIDTYRRTGFGGGISWYRNLTRNWRASAGLGQIVRCPALMISASDDVVLPPSLTDGMEAYVPDLERRVLSDCGHWTQHEQPEALNSALLAWLGHRFPVAKDQP